VFLSLWQYNENIRVDFMRILVCAQFESSNVGRTCLYLYLWVMVSFLSFNIPSIKTSIILFHEQFSGLLIWYSTVEVIIGSIIERSQLLTCLDWLIMLYWFVVCIQSEKHYWQLALALTSSTWKWTHTGME